MTIRKQLFNRDPDFEIWICVFDIDKQYYTNYWTEELFLREAHHSNRSRFGRLGFYMIGSLYYETILSHIDKLSESFNYKKYNEY